MQHSLAASINNKQTIYAAHNDMGKADLFVTLTPRDDLQYDILVYALLPEESILHKNVSPTKNFRFDLLAEKPVVAGLVFERVQHVHKNCVRMGHRKIIQMWWSIWHRKRFSASLRGAEPFHPPWTLFDLASWPRRYQITACQRHCWYSGTHAIDIPRH